MTILVARYPRSYQEILQEICHRAAARLPGNQPLPPIPPNASVVEATFGPS